MYTIISAKGIKNTPGGRWGDVDVSTESATALYHNYRTLYITVTAGFLPEPAHVDMLVFKAKYNTFEGTLQELLADNGAATFETVATLPSFDTSYVEYSDMFRAGYAVEVTGRNQHPSALISDVDKVDLRVHRPNPQTDMVDVYRNCLITVNGYYHMTDTDGEYLYVYEGGKNNYKSRSNSIGMLSFKEIGSITQYPITQEMIYKQSDGQSRFYDKTYIKLPDVSLRGKTVLLVLAGYLVLPTPGVFYQNSEDTFAIALDRLPLIERYYESFNHIDYSGLGLDVSQSNPTSVNVAQFYSDPTIVALLTHPQTFFVVVDTPHLFTNKYFLERTPIPGKYVCGFEPKLPLVLGRGKMPEYWKEFEIDRYSLTVVDGNLHRRVFTGLGIDDRVNVSDSEQPTPPHYNSQAYLLEIGSDLAD